MRPVVDLHFDTHLPQNRRLTFAHVDSAPPPPMGHDCPLPCQSARFCDTALPAVQIATTVTRLDILNGPWHNLPPTSQTDRPRSPCSHINAAQAQGTTPCHPCMPSPSEACPSDRSPEDCCRPFDWCFSVDTGRSSCWRGHSHPPPSFSQRDRRPHERTGPSLRRRCLSNL